MSYVLIASLSASVLVYAFILLVLIKKNSRKLRLQSRLEELARDESRPDKPLRAARRKDILSAGFSSLFHSNTLSKISSELSLAGISLKAEEFLMIWLFTGILIPFLFFLLNKNILIALGTAIFGAVIPPMIISRYKKKRTALFEAQLMDALIVISNCLRAGFTFQQAMDSIAGDMPEPISKEFGKVLREIKLGIPMDDALQDMVARLRNDDLELLVSAVLIQKQVGGNLADILDNIAGTINERLKLKGEIKVLTASGRTSGLVIGLMPVFLLAFLMIANPTYVKMFFTTTIGMAMLIVALVMEATGFMVIRKIVNIKF
jgi:tight adherence protein B